MLTGFAFLAVGAVILGLLVTQERASESNVRTWIRSFQLQEECSDE